LSVPSDAPLLFFSGCYAKPTPDRLMTEASSEHWSITKTRNDGYVVK